jgi:predicted AAA+ superfamily ATPase
MVLKSEIEISYKQQQAFLKQKNISETREKLVQVSLSEVFIVIITGIRRCGKSTLMQQLIKSLGTKSCVFFNFEDPRIFGFENSDFTKLDEIIGSENQYYFFDEIQNVDNWEIFVRNLHDKHKTICVTGSNASLLSRELGTKLTGRSIQIELLPFSYTEYCSFKKLNFDTDSYQLYIKEGGFPSFVKIGNKEILQQLFKDIIYRDIIVRHGIRNDKILISIALYLISNAAKEFSYTNIKNTFGVGSVNSVMDYVAWFEDSYLMFTLPRFSYSLKSVAINPKKIYVIDTGFGDANSNSFSADYGRMFENAVYLQLRRKYKEMYYFREKGECDFVVKEQDAITQAIQVCLEVNPENMDREMNGLIEALIFFKLETGYIITLNQEDVMIKDNKKVMLIPAWKWSVGFSTSMNDV